MQGTAVGSPSPVSVSSPRAASARMRSGRACSARLTGGSRATRSSTGTRRPYYDSPKDARRADRSEQYRDRRGDRGDRPGRPARPPIPSRIGTIFGTGVGGIHTLEEQIADPDREGRAPGLAVPRADDDGQRRRRVGLDAVRLQRAQRDDLHGVRGRHARPQLRRPPDRLGTRRRGRHGRHRARRHRRRRWPASAT